MPDPKFRPGDRVLLGPLSYTVELADTVGGEGVYWLRDGPNEVPEAALSPAEDLPEQRYHDDHCRGCDRCEGLCSGCETCERRYPCDGCGTLRSKREGGTTFTVCDSCWTSRRPGPGTATLDYNPDTGVLSVERTDSDAFAAGMEAAARIVEGMIDRLRGYPRVDVALREVVDEVRYQAAHRSTAKTANEDPR